MRQHVALLQLGPVHEEVSLGFLQTLLTLGCEVRIALHWLSLRKKGDVFDAIRRDCPNIDIVYHNMPLDGSANPKDLIKLIGHECETCILLTHQNEATARIARILIDKGMNILGVIHNNAILPKSENAILQYKKNLVHPLFLAKHVFDDSCEQWNNELRGAIHYNVFKPQTHRQRASDSILRIGILGAVSFDRLDYDGLIREIIENRDTWLNQVIFVVIGGGKDRKILEEQIKEHHLQPFFELSPLNNFGMCEYSMYYSFIWKCSAILCLKRIGRVSRMVNSKITSSVPSALSFGKPILSTTDFASRYRIHSIAFQGTRIAGQVSGVIEHNKLHGNMSSVFENCIKARDALIENNKKSMKSYLGD